MDLLKKYIDYAAMESKVLRDLVSSDISKTNDPSPPLPPQTKLNFEQIGWKWVLFWPQHCWGEWGSGGTTDEPKADQDIVM